MVVEPGRRRRPGAGASREDAAASELDAALGEITVRRHPVLAAEGSYPVRSVGVQLP